MRHTTKLIALVLFAAGCSAESDVSAAPRNKTTQATPASQTTTSSAPASAPPSQLEVPRDEGSSTPLELDGPSTGQAEAPLALIDGDEPDEVYRLAQFGMFCDDMTDLSTGQLYDPADLDAAYERMEENAPPPIAEDTQEFVRLSRVVAEAVLANVDTPERMQEEIYNADPAALELLEELKGAAETGQLGEGIGSSVMGWVVFNCDSQGHVWEATATAASFWIESKEAQATDKEHPIVDWLATEASLAKAETGIPSICVEGAEFEQLRTIFAGELVAHIAYGDQAFTLRLMGHDPRFTSMSCAIR